MPDLHYRHSRAEADLTFNSCKGKLAQDLLLPFLFKHPAWQSAMLACTGRVSALAGGQHPRSLAAPLTQRNPLAVRAIPVPKSDVIDDGDQQVLVSLEERFKMADMNG